MPQDITIMCSLPLDHFYKFFTVGEAVRSTCGNSHDEEKEKKNCLHLSLHQTILRPYNSFLDFGFPGFWASWILSFLYFVLTIFSVPGFWVSQILSFPDIGFPEWWVSQSLSFPYFWFPGFWASGILSSHILGFFWFSFLDFGLPRFWVSRIFSSCSGGQKSENQKMQIKPEYHWT